MHADRLIAFDQQALISEEHKRSNDGLLSSLDRNRNELPDPGNTGGLELAAVSVGDVVAATATFDRAQAVGRLENVTGWVTIVRADGTISEAHSGDLVHRGDVVQAGRDSSAGISFLDGTSVEVAAGSRMALDGHGLLHSAWPKPVQLALSDVRAEDETIKPFGTFDLLDGSRVVESVDNPDTIFELRRSPSGDLAVTRSSADPATQAEHYNEALRIQNLGEQYGINPNSRGSGTSPEPLLQRINFTDDPADFAQPPSVDPIGPRNSPAGQSIPDFLLITPPRVEQRAALTPSPVTGPTYADTVTLDQFNAVAGTLTASGAGAGATLTYGIAGGIIGTPMVLNGVSYDVSRSGAYGTLHVNSATGAYTLVPDDAAINSLTADTSASFTITVSDGTRSVNQTFTITLDGENDSPLLSPVTGSTYADTAAPDAFGALKGTLQATDVDAGTTLTYGIDGASVCGPTVLQGVSYDVSRSGTYGTLYVNSATGAYTFVPDDAAINALCGEATEAFTVTVSDGALSASRCVTVTLNGENDKPLLSPVTGPTYTDTWACDDFAAAAGVLQATDADAGATLTYGIDGATTCGPTVLQGVTYDLSRSGSYGTLYVNSESGAYTFVPDDAAINALCGDTTETFTVTVSDGALTDSQCFTVTLDDKNDDNETAAGEGVGDVDGAWIAGFVSSGRDGDQFDLANDIAGPEATTIITSTVAGEGQDSFLFEGPVAREQQPSVLLEVQPATSPVEGQQGAQGAANDSPVFEFTDLTSGIVQLQQGTQQDQFMLQP